MRRSFPLIIPFLFTIWGLIALAAVGAITGIAVTTSEQTVAPNTVSEKITVELQNASDEAEKIDESSNKLSLTSSSASGEFSSNTENWKAVNELTVNKNTASRSFYYKDGAEGTHTLSFTLTSGETDKVWATTHQIIISAGGGGNGDASTTPDQNATSTATTTTTTTTTNTIIYSSHESYAGLSAVPPPPFTVSAGRERLGNTEAPLIFHALGSGKNASGAQYRWAFGDGTGGSGERIEHRYPLPGRYIVVLTGATGGGEAVSRTTVQIAAPQIAIERGNRMPDGTLVLYIRNDSDYETNIGRWKAALGSSTESLAPDTIIPAHASVPISISLPFGAGPFTLIAPSSIAFSADASPVVEGADMRALTIGLRKLQNKTLVQKKTLVPREVGLATASPTSKTPEPAAKSEKSSATPPLITVSGVSQQARLDQSGQQAGILIVPKEEGFLERLWKRLRGR